MEKGRGGKGKKKREKKGNIFFKARGEERREKNGGRCGKSSESVQCAMLKACDACADMGQL